MLYGTIFARFMSQKAWGFFSIQCLVNLWSSNLQTIIECVARQAQQSCRQGSGQSHLLRAALSRVKAENGLEVSSACSPVAAPLTLSACQPLCFQVAFVCPKISLSLTCFAAQKRTEAVPFLHWQTSSGGWGQAMQGGCSQERVC